MSKNIAFLLIVCIGTLSCSSEKVSISPMNSSIANSSDAALVTFNDRVEKINYASEITNLISSIPKFSNEAVNKESSKLKSYLNGYIRSMGNFDMQEKNRSHREYLKSYKQLQKLKPYLKQDEAEVLNRYLVRIKSSMNVLENTSETENPVSIK